ncbi:MAG TPA: aldose epimerase family protein [Paludibacter sp.]|nr:aldose epimerase family protein [Paludibacter sp.]HOS44906.1 aldose epimerase family protein [Paludibacter sp.]HPM10283.1 aldose epimerase family protein [Paludibacter sp.]
MKHKLLFATVFVIAALGACKESKEVTRSGLDPAAFEKLIDGKPNQLYVLENTNGMEVCVTNFGARIVSILVPDKNGEMRDVVLGFDNIDDFLSHKTDFGAAIGRYGNRIADGKFTLDGVDYQLTINNEPNSLHGGITGFQYQMFDIEQVDATTLACTFFSPDGDNGYPGNLQVKVIYTLTDDNAIDIAYEAETDQATVINLTNHSYFNLSGDPQQNVLDHVVYMNSDRYTPVNEFMIPTGEIVCVENTPMDFRTPYAIGERIDADYGQLTLAGGYDHNWIFTAPSNIEVLACQATCPQTGITLDVYTDEPAVQFYTGNFLDGTVTGKNAIVYNIRTGFCLETQHYPDSPNQPEFPSTVLRPGETYTSRCIYKFSVK